MVISLLLAASMGGLSPISVFPMPNDVRRSGGDIHMPGVVVRSDPRLSSEGDVAKECFNPRTGLQLRLKWNPNLGAEGYRLTSRQSGIQIEGSAAGVFYGIQTLRQLAIRTPKGYDVPQVDITDSPRFPWRGMMLDVSRHFFPKSDILHLLDLLSEFKINTFHWHLVDDGGWRIQIKKYPQLTEWGAWRLPSDGTFPEYKGLSFPGRSTSNKLYGGFYTQEDVREIVKYAARKHINIVPEIEMPGHNLGATMSYPWLICSPKLKADFQKAEGFVWPNIFCAGKESTFKFVEDVLDEVMSLFPSKVIHIGGDEVDKFLWNRCDDCKARMKAEHLKDTAELESYFVQRVEKYVRAHGRHIIGWDEILEGGLAENAYVMSWRGEAGGIAAAKLKHNVIMTPWDQCYFDHSNEELPVSAVLAYDPAPPSRGPQLAKYVLGAQCNIWTETLPERKNIENRLMPRLLAMSQILWTRHHETSQSFERRLNALVPVLYQQAPGMYIQAPQTDWTVVAPGQPIQFTYPAIPNAQLRYTLEGSRPTSHSNRVTRAISLGENQTATVGLVSPNGLLSELTRVTACHIKPTDPRPTSPGLVYDVYPGTFNKVPDFSALSATTSGVLSTVKLVGDLQVNYAIRYIGYLSIPRVGTYTLSCLSDDGSDIWLDHKRIVDNDGPHGRIRRSATLRLLPGLYPLQLGYFQGTEGQSMTFEISGPGLPNQEVPASMLRH